MITASSVTSEEEWYGSIPPAVSIVAVCSFFMSCSVHPLSLQEAQHVLSADGLSVWHVQDTALKKEQDKASLMYERAQSIETLRRYDVAVKGYLDHGFFLYRAYTIRQEDPPADLISSLHSRLATYMDIADEYLKQGSRAMATGMASDVVQNYSDLSVMAPAQRRAEAILLRYRYRSDY